MILKQCFHVVNRRNIFITMMFCFLIICFVYSQRSLKKVNTITLLETNSIRAIDLREFDVSSIAHRADIDTNEIDGNYLVDSSQCKIPNIYHFANEILPYYDPKKYIACTKSELLTYISKEGGVPILRVNKTASTLYSPDGITCCYKNITRKYDEDNPDDYVSVSPCARFQDSLILPTEVISVWCKGNSLGKVVYENVHTAVKIKKPVARKMEQFKSEAKKNHISILFVGIDSISRLNFKRSLPYTNAFLKRKGWLEFRGYNKIEDNTYPNLMAILTGMNETELFEKHSPRVVGNMDKVSLLMYDYRDLGYITGYAEDEAEINTFNYFKKGFKEEPTDYYWRPYILATEKLLKRVSIDVTTYCTGPETAGERIMNVARDFSSSFKDYPNFGFFWMNSFSHNDINAVSRMDNKILDFLNSLYSENIVENSVIIFLSDHGFRFGSIVYTHTGWLEERLPFLYIHVPKWFQEKYPQEYENLKTNTNRLTSPYDLFMTLQHILLLEGKKFKTRPSRACPQCKSLFYEVDRERTCSESGIPNHWCTCNGHLTMDANSALAEQAAQFVLSEVHNTVIKNGGDFTMCKELEVNKIMSAGISDTEGNINNKTVLITFETKPSAVFQGTVKIEGNSSLVFFKSQGSISRLDVYKDHSWCVDDSTLKKYCYCKSRTDYLFGAVNDMFNAI